MYPALTDAIEQVAAGDLDALTDTELDATIAALMAARDRLAVATARVVREWDLRRTWALDGSKSPAHRMARLTNRSVVSCKVEVRRARALPKLPATTAAVADGVLSVDHLDLLARAAGSERGGVFADHEAGLVDTVTGLAYRDAAVVVHRWIAHADALTDDPPPPAPPEDPTQDRELFASKTIDGTIELTGHLDPLGGTIFRNELDRLTEHERRHDLTTGVDRTPAQRRAAALIAMAQRSATVTTGTPPRVVLQVLVGEGTLRHLCELYDGTQLPVGTLQPYVDDAFVESILFDGPKTVLSVSRKRRFTGALRTAIRARDRHCQHPSGCDVPADACDIDHITPYAAGGLTSQANGRLECPTHNRLPDRHDHGAEPPPERPVTILDVIRARLHRREQRAWEQHQRRRLDRPDHTGRPRRRTRPSRPTRRATTTTLRHVAARTTTHLPTAA